MPSLLSAEHASIPSRMSGSFTTTFLWIFASSRPSGIIAFASVDTTSALMGPSMMSQMAAICSLIGFPSLAISEGLVVTPSTIPHFAPARSSSRFAVSRKNFICLLVYRGTRELPREQELADVGPAFHQGMSLSGFCGWKNLVDDGPDRARFDEGPDDFMKPAGDGAFEGDGARP